MGKEGVFLKYRIQLPFVWRERSDIFSVENDTPLIRGFKTAQDAKCGGFATTAGA